MTTVTIQMVKVPSMGFTKCHFYIQSFAVTIASYTAEQYSGTAAILHVDLSSNIPNDRTDVNGR